jgi:hypothetical protein
MVWGVNLAAGLMPHTIGVVLKDFFIEGERLSALRVVELMGGALRTQ